MLVGDREVIPTPMSFAFLDEGCNSVLPKAAFACIETIKGRRSGRPVRKQMSIPHYDLVDLRLFINIAEAGNLTRGANRSNLSLGSVSLRIKNLEEALGTQLLRRHSAGVDLTSAGKVLLGHALRVYQQLECLHGDLQAFSHGLKGKVRIFANTTAITELLPAALGAWLATHPQVDIDLEEKLSPDIARAVADGSVDIGILAGTVQADGLEMIPYQHDRLVLAVPFGHALSEENEIAFAQATGLNFVSLHAGSAIHSFADQVASDMGVSLNVRIRVSGFEAMCRMIEANVGVGLLPASVAVRLQASHKIKALRLSDEWAERELKICLRNLHELPAFAQELVEFLVQDQVDYIFRSSL